MSKFKQRELWVSAAAVGAALLAPKLGVPEDALQEVIVGIFGVASAYVLSRGLNKGLAGVDR